MDLRIKIGRQEARIVGSLVWLQSDVLELAVHWRI